MFALRSTLPAVIALVLSAGCVSNPATIEPIRHASGMADAQVAASYIRSPRPDRFSVCHEHTCHAITDVSLSAEDWANVKRVFVAPAANAAAEREQIARAIAALELLVGARTGTANDLGENLPGLGLSGQMDCVDESTNTSAYLLMLQQDGLLHWHQVGARISRGILQLTTLHFTASVKESTSGDGFAVDSWFEPNGSRPDIVPLAEWRRGRRQADNNPRTGRIVGRD